MKHKWARKNYRALKNCYQFMQMAQLIHQLMLKRQAFVNTYLIVVNHPHYESPME